MVTIPIEEKTELKVFMLCIIMCCILKVCFSELEDGPLVFFHSYILQFLNSLKCIVKNCSVPVVYGDPDLC